MSSPTNPRIPSAALTVTDPDNWEEEATNFAAELIVRGERPWFELRYPAPAHLPLAEQHEWLARQEETFDAIELVAGEFVTLPPYAELEAEVG